MAFFQTLNVQNNFKITLLMSGLNNSKNVNIVENAYLTTFAA